MFAAEPDARYWGGKDSCACYGIVASRVSFYMPQSLVAGTGLQTKRFIVAGRQKARRVRQLKRPIRARRVVRPVAVSNGAFMFTS